MPPYGKQCVHVLNMSFRYARWPTYAHWRNHATLRPDSYVTTTQRCLLYATALCLAVAWRRSSERRKSKEVQIELRSAGLSRGSGSKKSAVIMPMYCASPAKPTAWRHPHTNGAAGHYPSARQSGSTRPMTAPEQASLLQTARQHLQLECR